MTVASMTGFARATGESALGGLAWELKCVNGKGLDVRLRLPTGLDGAEARFRTRIAAEVGRGTFQAALTLQRAPRPAQVRVDRSLLRALVDAVSDAVPHAAAIGPATLDGLLAVRGVVDVGEPADTAEDRETLTAAAAELLDSALAQLQAVRRGEGAALAAVLARQLDRLSDLVEAADRAPGRAPAAVREKLARSVATLIQDGAGLDPNRLHQEALLLAARADVQEELDRLRTHVAAARALLADGGVVGRRLDFLAQELGREANTLCAKSSDAGLTAVGLDLRTTIEQVREQVQNLE